MQGELERVLSRLLNAPARVTGSGRTDRGVHATGQVAAADVDEAPTPSARAAAATARRAAATADQIEKLPLTPGTALVQLGGPGMRTAYVTLSSLGKLVAVPWPRVSNRPMRSTSPQRTRDQARRSVAATSSRTRAACLGS